MDNMKNIRLTDRSTYLVSFNRNSKRNGRTFKTLEEAIENRDYFEIHGKFKDKPVNPMRNIYYNKKLKNPNYRVQYMKNWKHYGKSFKTLEEAQDYRDTVVRNEAFSTFITNVIW